MSFIKNFISEGKPGTVATKAKLVTKIKTLRSIIALFWNFGFLTSYCYCGDNV